MGLPQLDFRVPEATWFKSALAGKFAMPGLSATGALAWPYKVAVVAVMALVACGTLVTFGSAGAETPSSSQASALPGSDEVSPTIEGQVLPPTQALLNSDDLMSSLNLTDYSPGDTTTISLADDDDDEDKKKSDEKAKAAIKKKLATPTPKPTTTTKPTSTPTPTPTKTTEAPRVEGPKHKAWVQAKSEYDQALAEWNKENTEYQNCVKGNSLVPIVCEDKKPGDKPSDPGSEPDFTS